MDDRQAPAPKLRVDGAYREDDGPLPTSKSRYARCPPGRRSGSPRWGGPKRGWTPVSEGLASSAISPLRVLK